MINRFLRLPEVGTVQGIKRSTIYNRIADGTFPRPVRLGPRMVAWPESEIAALNAAIVRGESEDSIKALVSQLEADRKKAAA